MARSGEDYGHIIEPTIPLPKIKEALTKSAGIVGLAAEALMVSRRTMHSWINSFPELQSHLADCKECNIDIAENGIIQNMKDRDNTAMIFYLRCQAKRRGFVQTEQVEIITNPYDNMSELELDAAIQDREARLSALA